MPNILEVLGSNPQKEEKESVVAKEHSRGTAGTLALGDGQEDQEFKDSLHYRGQGKFPETLSKKKKFSLNTQQVQG